MATYGPVPHTLRDGATLTLRSPTPDDAPALLDYLDVVRRETDFLMVGPSDEMFTVEREREWIKEQGDGPDCVQIAAWHDGRPVGLAGVKADGPFARVRHRATLGISLLAEWSGRGLGTHLTRELVSWAERHPAILVVRLGVFADNRAGGGGLPQVRLRGGGSPALGRAAGGRDAGGRARHEPLGRRRVKVE